MRLAIAVLASCTLLALSSCAAAKYWVKGLDLPPGSTIVSRSETTLSQSALPPALTGMPGMGPAGKMLMVAFNCPGGWSAVSAHLDRRMATAGYSDQMQSMFGGDLAGLNSTQSAAMNQALAGMKFYSKSGSKLSVIVMDNNAVIAGAGQMVGQNVPPGGPGLDQFNLAVMKEQ